MTPATRQEVLGLYRKILQIAKNWQSASGQIEETVREKEYIRNEARTLFRKNKNRKYHVWVKNSFFSFSPDSLWASTFSAIKPRTVESRKIPMFPFMDLKNRIIVTDPKLIKQCIEECEARIEIGLHYNIPYPRPIHLPPMGLAHKQGRMLRHQEKLRKISKPIYLKSHEEVS